jgi:hypothetical protein
LADADVRPLLQGIKIEQHPKQKNRYWGQYGAEAPFVRAVMDITGKPLG